jgi:NAD(P)-dependent dehydrogenase (short-subunit alcohol dehydrogenase family)
MIRTLFCSMKNYLIIGASSGIGEAVAFLLSQNSNVFGTYCNNQPHLPQQNTSYNYLNVLNDNYDLSFLPDHLDGIVYCPGAINLKPFARINPNDFVEDYKLQVLGAIKIIQQCFPKLKNAESASIVLFSTVAVQTGFNFHSIVSSSKGAIEGLTKALSAELAPKIRVNCIAPSITQTPLANSLLSTPEKVEANAQRHPLKKVGTVQDIANATEFLLTNKSAWVTGQIFHIDGGMSTIK